MENYITEIVAPSLTDVSYGKSIDQQFENINENFRKVGNHDFIKGQPGDSIEIENVKIFNYDNTGELSEIELLGSNLYNALKNAVEEFAKSESSVIDNPLCSVGEFNWDDAIMKSDFNIPIVVYKNSVNDTKEYVCSASTVSFFDNRFSADAIEANQNAESNIYDNGVVDVTSLLNFKKNNGEWSCTLNLSFPRLKYKDGLFYWVINNDNTTIKSTGIKGDRGESGIVYVGLCEAFPTEYENTPIIITQFLNSAGKWDPQVPASLKIGDTIIVYYKSEDSDDYLGYSITRITNINGNTVQAEYNPSSNISYIDFAGKTKEFFKLLGSEAMDSKNNPARGIFLLMDNPRKNGESITQDENIEDSYAHMIYNNGGELNISPVQTYEFEGGYPELIDNENLKLNINYNTNIKGNTSITGNTDIKASNTIIKLNSTGVGIESSDIRLKGNTTISSDEEDSELKITSASIGIKTGTTNIKGNVSIDGDMSIDGDVAIQDKKLTVTCPTHSGGIDKHNCLNVDPANETVTLCSVDEGVGIIETDGGYIDLKAQESLSGGQKSGIRMHYTDGVNIAWWDKDNASGSELIVTSAEIGITAKNTKITGEAEIDGNMEITGDVNFYEPYNERNIFKTTSAEVGIYLPTTIIPENIPKDPDDITQKGKTGLRVQGGGVENILGGVSLYGDAIKVTHGNITVEDGNIVVENENVITGMLRPRRNYMYISSSDNDANTIDLKTYRWNYEIDIVWAADLVNNMKIKYGDITMIPGSQDTYKINIYKQGDNSGTIGIYGRDNLKAEKTFNVASGEVCGVMFITNNLAGGNIRTFGAGITLKS